MNPQNALANTAGLPREKLVPNPKARLQDQFHEVARFKHLSYRTETAYWEWVVRFLKFHRKLAGDWRHPREMGKAEVGGVFELPNYKDSSPAGFFRHKQPSAVPLKIRDVGFQDSRPSMQDRTTPPLDATQCRKPLSPAKCIKTPAKETIGVIS